jgi:cellulose synthase/poly-beta-1,6-N-acetylglucosamine synthase-like glycosyltransferase
MSPELLTVPLTALYALCQAALATYAGHRWPMLGCRAAKPVLTPPVPLPPGNEPNVLVQLPVRDEPEVVGRLLEAAAALDWPRDRLEIQLLDDSGEAAAALGRAAVQAARARGVKATHMRRGTREGFKAGALAHGSRASLAEFVAVFDADFVPAPDFLRRMLPSFADPGVGMVQARWGHLNRDESLLTRAQAAMLDAHFLVEHPWRAATGRFLNFNGTAGVWRRACIESAGGWSADTLTEDLDLSYRAQLAGWRFAFAPAVVVPAELPGSMDALKTQQHRWAKGAFQTARKVLRGVFAASLPSHVRSEAVFHLTANAIYPLLLVLATLMVPILSGAAALPLPLALALHAGLVAAGTLPVVAFLWLGARRAGRGRGEAAVDALAALVLCAGLSWQLTRAVWEGLAGEAGEFVRTPKQGRLAERTPRIRPRMAPAEWLLATGSLAAMTWAVAKGAPGAVPFYATLALGLGWVASGARGRSR